MTWGQGTKKFSLAIFRLKGEKRYFSFALAPQVGKEADKEKPREMLKHPLPKGDFFPLGYHCCAFVPRLGLLLS